MSTSVLNDVEVPEAVPLLSVIYRAALYLTNFTLQHVLVNFLHSAHADWILEFRLCLT